MEIRKNALLKQFIDIFGNSDNVIETYAAPGRVNLIGEHIDYCGGFVFPAALTLDTMVAVRKNGTDKFRLAATDLQGIFEFSLDNIAAAENLPWGNYQAGIVNEFLKRGIIVHGLDMLFDATIPFGSGLSSSAAIELSTAFALNDVFGAGLTKIELAKLSQDAEHNFCHVNCGIMDQFASAMGLENHAMLLNCSTLDYQYVPLNLGNNVLILANTCKKHALGASKYNERRAEVAEGLTIMNNAALSHGRPTHDNLCEFSSEDLEINENFFENPIILKRVKHVITENERVISAVNVLKSGDIQAFGNLMRSANDSIRNLYEATGAELDAMWDAAASFDGCIGCRMTGGGFGGCTVNIVDSSRADEFISYVGAKYKAATGIDPAFYVCKIGDGVRKID